MMVKVSMTMAALLLVVPIEGYRSDGRGSTANPFGVVKTKSTESSKASTTTTCTTQQRVVPLVNPSKLVDLEELNFDVRKYHNNNDNNDNKNMKLKTLLDELEGETKEEFAKHPMFSWLRSDEAMMATKPGKEEDPRRILECFMPILNFIITFPYYNNIYLRYDDVGDGNNEDGVSDKMKRSINTHAEEDSTHADLFLKDLDSMKLDQAWGMPNVSSWLWGLFLSPRFSLVRKYNTERVRLLVRDRDTEPHIRFLHIEQIEMDGNLLFGASLSAAKKIETFLAGKGEGTTDVIYFGEHHFDLENGHVVVASEEDSSEESVFEEVVLHSPEEQRYVKDLLERKDYLSHVVFDESHSFAKEVSKMESMGSFFQTEMDEMDKVLQEKLQLPKEEQPKEIVITPNRGWQQKNRLVQAWFEGHDKFLSHPVWDLLRNIPNDEEELGHALRSSLGLFASRIMSLLTVYTDDCGCESEQITNLGKNFATEMFLAMKDWKTLDMDNYMQGNNKSVASVLDFLFFDEECGKPEWTFLFEFRRQLLSKSSPLFKYWGILSIHMMSKAFFSGVPDLAKRYGEITNNQKEPLHYLLGQHHFLYQHDVEDDINRLSLIPLEEEEEEAVLKMIDLCVELGMKQFDMLYRFIDSKHSF